MTLKIGADELKKVAYTKFLGLIIDQHLMWDKHIEYGANKVARGVYALQSVKLILSSKHLRILYCALINPYMLYGHLLWGSAHKTHETDRNPAKESYSCN